jgi:hypothetical protein
MKRNRSIMRATVGKVAETQLLVQTTTILQERMVRQSSTGSLMRVGAALNGDKLPAAASAAAASAAAADAIDEDDEEDEGDEEPSAAAAAAKALTMAAGASNSIPRRILKSGTKQTRKWNIPTMQTSSGPRVVSARRYGLPGTSVRVKGKPKEMVSFF